MLIDSDRPINRYEDDKLDRKSFIETLSATLVSAQGDSVTSTGLVVGLTGQWGSGKSSIMMLMDQTLTSKGAIVVHFNPWLCKGRDELLDYFFISMRSAIKGKCGNDTRDVVNALDRYWSVIEVAGNGVVGVVEFLTSIPYLGKVFSWATRQARTYLDSIPPAGLTDLRRDLEQEIVKSSLSIVVLIDELDRVEDEEVRVVAQLIKALGDIEGLSYLVAYDPDRVIKALGGADEGARYLEKIIQLSVPLRPMLDGEAESFLLDSLPVPEFRDINSHDDYRCELFQEVAKLVKTPRDVKRLSGTLSVIYRAVSDEICPYDLLAYSWMYVKKPTVWKELERNLEYLVSDPAQGGAFGGLEIRGKADDLQKLFSGEYAEFFPLLRLMFPRFSSDGSRPPEGSDNRIFKRRNLNRLLYLGDPPRTMRRHAIQSLWADPALDLLEEKLRDHIETGMITYLLDRLDDLLPELPEGGDTPFWLSLSRALSFDDYSEAIDSRPSVARHAAETLIHFMNRTEEQKSRHLDLIRDLQNSGDFIFVPRIVRMALFSHGMTVHDDVPRRESFLGRKEIERLRDLEVERCSRALMNGDLLKKTPTLETIYLILNVDAWSAEHKKSLTDQLSDRSALIRFSGLLVPPNNTINLETLDKMIDIPKVQQLVELELQQEVDDWTSLVLSRLQRAMSGILSIL